MLGSLQAGGGAEHQLVPLVEQPRWRASSERRQQRRGHERRALQALSDVVPQRVLYLRRLAHAYDDQLAVIQAHQDVALLLGDGDAADGKPHGHGLRAERQAAQQKRPRLAQLAKNNQITETEKIFSLIYVNKNVN